MKEGNFNISLYTLLFLFPPQICITAIIITIIQKWVERVNLEEWTLRIFKPWRQMSFAPKLDYLDIYIAIWFLLFRHRNLTSFKSQKYLPHSHSPFCHLENHQYWRKGIFLSSLLELKIIFSNWNYNKTGQ